ncbi:Response regulator receiver [gamma proteobacterium HdN1]|nr:Response regulator receiver [gamma proteobacterium HdN1]
MNQLEQIRAQQTRVLLIESDPTTRDMLQQWLTEDSALVLSAGNGQHGIALLTSFQPDVVVCDMRLPDRLGLEVLEIAQRVCPDSRVIMTSAVSDTVMVVQSLRLGAADYLFKPFKQPVMLLHAVRRAASDARLMLENRRYREMLEEKNRELNESLRVLREDQEAGRAVQLKIMPPPQKSYGAIDINFRIKPSLYLSGDFVDHFTISKNQVGFYLADVSGHGASSAFVTILLKTMTNRLRKRYEDVSRRVLLPAEILERANEEMLSMGLGKHLSVFCGLIDFEAGQLVYSSAAHYPPPRLFMANHVHVLEDHGLPVGLFQNPGYQNRTVPLAGHFELWACSDGALEVLDGASLALKEQKLVEIMEQANHNVDNFLSLLGITEQASVPDDIAVLLVSGQC